MTSLSCPPFFPFAFLCHHYPFLGSRTFIIGSSPHKHNQRPQGGWNYKADGGLSGGLGGGPKVSAGEGDDCAEDGGGGGGKDGE